MRVTSEIADPKTEEYGPNTVKSLSLISPPPLLSLCLSVYLSIRLSFSIISPSHFIPYPPIFVSVCLCLPLLPPTPAFLSSFLMQCVKIGRGYFNILQEENAMKKKQQQLQKLREEELNKFQPAKKYSDIQCRDNMMT